MIKYKALFHSKEEKMEFRDQKRLAYINYRHEYAMLTIKSAILINGGGALAIMTLLGAISKDKNFNLLGSPLFLAAIFFSTGACLAAASAGTSNLSQSQYIEKREKAGEIWKTSSIALLICSYLIFVFNMIFIYYQMFQTQCNTSSILLKI